MTQALFLINDGGNLLNDWSDPAYNGIQGQNWWGLNEDNIKHPMPTGGTFRNMRMDLDVAPGIGESWTFTLRKNGADTAVTITISGTDTTGSDTTHSVTFSAGDYICYKATRTATAALPQVKAVIEFTGDIAKESIYFGGPFDPHNQTFSQSATRGIPFLGTGPTDGQFPESLIKQLAPTSGTLSKLYVYCPTAPGAGKSRTITLRVNGSSSAVTCAVANAATTANDTTHSASIAAGDQISGIWVPSGTPAESGANFGIVFTADIDGESIQSIAIDDQPGPGEKMTVSGGMSHNTDEDALKSICPATAAIAKKGYGKLAVAPGVGTAWNITLRKNKADSALVVVVSGTGTTGNDTTHTVAFASGDTINWATEPTGSPGDTAPVSYAFVWFIEPASAGPTASRRAIITT